MKIHLCQRKIKKKISGRDVYKGGLVRVTEMPRERKRARETDREREGLVSERERRGVIVTD